VAGEGRRPRHGRLGGGVDSGAWRHRARRAAAARLPVSGGVGLRVAAAAAFARAAAEGGGGEAALDRWAARTARVGPAGSEVVVKKGGKAWVDGISAVSRAVTTALVLQVAGVVVPDGLLSFPLGLGWSSTIADATVSSLRARALQLRTPAVLRRAIVRPHMALVQLATFPHSCFRPTGSCRVGNQ